MLIFKEKEFKYTSKNLILLDDYKILLAYKNIHVVKQTLKDKQMLNTYS